MIAGILLCVALYFFSKWLVKDTKKGIQKDVEAGIGWIYLVAPILFFYVYANTKQGFVGSLCIAVIGTFFLALSKDGMVFTPLAMVAIYGVLTEYLDWFPIFACLLTCFMGYNMIPFEVLSSSNDESEPSSVSSDKVK